MDDCYEPPEPIFSNSIQSRARKKYVKLESGHVRPVPLDRTISIRQTDLLFSSSVSLIAVWRKIRLQGVSCVDSSDGRTTTKCSHGRGRAGGLANSVLLFVATAREESSVLLQGGKKNGRRFGCDGTRSRPQDQAARLGFRSVGPFPLPFCSILSFLLSWPASVEQRRDEREKERSANHRTGSLRGDPREYHLAMGKKPFHGFYHY